MLALLPLLFAVLCPAVWAQSATILPMAVGTEANLQGEIIGSGGEVGTTYVLSGETLGVPFTMTVAQDANFIAQKISIPELSLDRNVGCVVSAASAVCANIVVSAGVTSTLPITTVPYSPIAVPVSTSGVVAASSSIALESTASASASGSSAPSATLISSPSASQSSTSDALRSSPDVFATFMFAITSGLLWFLA